MSLNSSPDLPERAGPQGEEAQGQQARKGWAGGWQWWCGHPGSGSWGRVYSKESMRKCTRSNWCTEPSGPGHSRHWVSDPRVTGPPQGLCRGLGLPPARSSKPHPVLCCHGSSAGLGQQHSHASRCQKVIAKASHTHSVTQPHTVTHALQLLCGLSSLLLDDYWLHCFLPDTAYTAHPHALHTHADTNTHKHINKHTCVHTHS